VVIRTLTGEWSGQACRHSGRAIEKTYIDLGTADDTSVKNETLTVTGTFVWRSAKTGTTVVAHDEFLRFESHNMALRGKTAVTDGITTCSPEKKSGEY
jgi:hypothetical protein